MGKLVRAMAENGSAACWALDSKDMVSALEEIQEKYGFGANAIVTMGEVVEYLYNRPCQGKVVIDDSMKAAIQEYYKAYGAEAIRKELL